MVIVTPFRTTEDKEKEEKGFSSFKLSDLSLEDQDCFKNEWTAEYKEILEEYVSPRIKELSTFFQKERKRTGKEGVLRFDIRGEIQPYDYWVQDLRLGLAEGEKENTINFCSFDEIGGGKDWQVRNLCSMHQSQERCKMGVIYLDLRQREYLRVSRRQNILIDRVLSFADTYDIEDPTKETQEERDLRLRAKKERRNIEDALEQDLYRWVESEGYKVERQVTTAYNHRLDLWLADKTILELKQGRVSGEDVCQAIDYAATYQLPIVLVGNGLSTSASRGIDGFNRAMKKNAIIFVTWGGVKPYITGLYKA